MYTSPPSNEGTGLMFSATRDLISEVISLANSGSTITDIHIEQDAPIMIKTPRGWLVQNEEPVTLEDMVPLLSTIESNWEHKLSDGAIDRPFALTQCRLRCNLFRLAGGKRVGVSIRRLTLNPLPLEKTGIPLFIKSALEATKGLILVTGPTGSGKTTTIASMLDHISATRNLHIVTIEHPIEYTLDRRRSIVTQKEVPTDVPSFSIGLKDAMRQRPDVIMVGEIRDFDTADTVLHAAESGHLVIASMHTNSAASAISKLIAFFPSSQQEAKAASIAASLLAVVSQSLLPHENGEEFVLASELLFNNNLQAMPLISPLEKLPRIADFLRRKEDNMSRSLNDDLAQLVAKKVISPREALRCAYNRAELHDMINKRQS